MRADATASAKRTCHQRQEAAASANVNDQIVLLDRRLDPPPVRLVPLRVLQPLPTSVTHPSSQTHAAGSSAARAARSEEAGRGGGGGAEACSMSKW